MPPCMWSEARQVPFRSACGLRLVITGPAWSSSSGELKGSQVLPDLNYLLFSGVLGGPRVHYLVGEPLEAISYQRGFGLHNRP